MLREQDGMAFLRGVRREIVDGVANRIGGESGKGQVVWEWGGRTEMTRGQEVCGGENGENPPQFVETKKIKRYLCPLKTTKPHNDIQQ